MKQAGIRTFAPCQQAGLCTATDALPAASAETVYISVVSIWVRQTQRAGMRGAVIQSGKCAHVCTCLHILHFKTLHVQVVKPQQGNSVRNLETCIKR